MVSLAFSYIQSIPFSCLKKNKENKQTNFEQAEASATSRQISFQLKCSFSAPMVWKLLSYLKRSRPYRTTYEKLIRTPDLDIESEISAIVKIKNIKSWSSRESLENLRQCLLCLSSWNEITRDLNEISLQRFDHKNEGNQKLLEQLWEQTIGRYENKWNKNGRKINLQSDSRWQLIGFQGKTPRSDFRGLDLLSLNAVLWFGEKYEKYNQRILYDTLAHDRSNDWFSYFITGINFTFATYQLFVGCSINDFINAKKTTPLPCWNDHNRLTNALLQQQSQTSPRRDKREDTSSYADEFEQAFGFQCHHIDELRLSVVFQFFSSYFVLFNEFWKKEKPKTVMEFQIVHKKFQDELATLLQNGQMLILKDRNEQDDVEQNILMDNDDILLDIVRSAYQQN
ncbi:hypothetical protein RFI_25198 [Reticulomyxa filosa]|uniref:ELMO domain-containing protein n=1 Tax=Reticulomyxa filosa TaxID=46433 RepID=X6MDT8_RETFI|nr:hypothetical protein RFI_25198 [Reticulomyxa filosa]|eukprot:ETO12183.1 hypothetical protein RFI_25198 [Reticulomyxa filosa]